MNDIDWRSLSVDSLILTLDQGEKLLKETIDTANFQNLRASFILKSSLGVFLPVFGYVLTVQPDSSLIYLEAVTLTVILLSIMGITA